MHKVWQLFNPRMALTGLFAFLFLLAFLIHFILLSSPDFDWLADDPGYTAEEVAGLTILPAGR